MGIWDDAWDRVDEIPGRLFDWGVDAVKFAAQQVIDDVKEEYRWKKGLNYDSTRQVLDGVVAMSFPPSVIIDFDDPNAYACDIEVFLDDPNIEENHWEQDGRCPQIGDWIRIEVDYIDRDEFYSGGYTVHALLYRND